MIDAYLNDNHISPHSQTFDRKLEQLFEKDSHISSFSPNFFMFFLLGFHDSLLTHTIRSKYGIEHIFHIWYDKFSLAKFFILINKDGKKKIILRNFYLSDEAVDKAEVPILFTDKEKKMVERDLSRFRKFQKLYDEADGQFREMSFEGYQRHFIKLFSQSDPDGVSMQVIEAIYPNMLDEYDFEAKEYALQEIKHQAGKEKKLDNRPLFPNSPEVLLESNINVGREDVLLLTDDRDIFESDQYMPEAPWANIFKEAFSFNQPQNKQKDLFKALHRKIELLFKTQSSKLGHTETRRAEQCAFKFGSLT
uniref:Uncharacterized protein n=1 Tax=Romanomermis culicivorax TaxID=13658 RepID=A0A915JLU4_ROMCU